MVRLELVGLRFGRLIVLEGLGSRQGKSLWQCQCDCGNLCELDSRQIRVRGSCGCDRNLFGLQKGRPLDLVAAVKAKRHCDSSTRSAWRSMFIRAALRRVEVEVRWHDFGEFLVDMGVRPSMHHGVARINLVGKFVPGNCRWMTVKERHALRRRLRATGPRHFASEFFICGKFSWEKWRAAGSPDYEIET